MHGRGYHENGFLNYCYLLLGFKDLKGECGQKLRGIFSSLCGQGMGLQGEIPISLRDEIQIVLTTCFQSTNCSNE